MIVVRILATVGFVILFVMGIAFCVGAILDAVTGPNWWEPIALSPFWGFAILLSSWSLYHVWADPL